MESSHGGPLIYGVSAFLGDDVDCGASKRASESSEAENRRMREMFFLRETEGQPKDPEVLRLPIRIRAQFTTGHKINRKLRLNPKDLHGRPHAESKKCDRVLNRHRPD